MYMKKRAVSILLTLLMILELTAPASTAAVPDLSSSDCGVTIRQTAEWNSKIPGSTVANVTLQVTSEPRLQIPRDVVIVVDHAASQELGSWQTKAKELAGLLGAVPGTRFALVSYESRAKTLLDFTSDLSALNAAVDGIRLGVNCNAYAGLREAKGLIDGRTDKSNAPCIALFSNGKFNLNLRLTETFGVDLARSVPIYGISGGSYSMGIMRTVCTSLMTVREMAIAIGGSQTAGPVTVTSSLDAGFTPVSGGSRDVSFSIDNFQYGRTYTFQFSGQLADPTRTGTLTVTGTASASGNGISASAPPAALARSGLAVTYNANGGSGVPVDNNRYAPGEMVSVKPGVPWKQGWNFSGWTLGGQPVGPAFAINQDTTLTAGWGRGYVKLSSSTVSANLKGNQMMDKAGILDRYPDKAFYGPSVRINLDSIKVCAKIDIPVGAESWEIGDEAAGTTSNAVMAWLVPSEADPTKNTLCIGAKGGVTAPANCDGLFCQEYFERITSISGLNYLDTSQVTSMNDVFDSNRYLKELDLSTWDTSNVTGMSGMFENCNNLETIIFGDKWETQKVTQMNGMFDGCSKLTSLDLRNWNTSQVTDMGSLFDSCTRLADLKLPARFVTSEVTDISRLFSGCAALTELNLSEWDTSNVSTMSYTFGDCKSLRTLDVSNWKTEQVLHASCLFANCEQLENLNLSGWTGFRYDPDPTAMFQNCKSLQSIDVSNWTVSGIKYMSFMFAGCSSLKELDLSNWQTSWLERLDNTFAGCSSLKILDLSNWYMERVTKMDKMFMDCTSLTSIGTIQLNVAKGCTAQYLQSGCPNLQKIQVMAGGEEIDTLYGQTAPASALASQSDALPIPEETFLASASALAASGADLDANGRPVYADEKTGLWDCGEVVEGQEIFYSLEVQYLDEAHGNNGASGVMTVTNPLPAGLIYNGDAQIIGPQRIFSGDNGPTRGTIVSNPNVSGGVLTFQVSGLSAGAKFTVTYSCTVPTPGPAAYTEYLNTASVNDGGLLDEADPVLHYIQERTEEPCTVTYSYVNAPAGVEVPPVWRGAAGTSISLPQPAAPAGCTFNGWQVNSTPVSDPYTVTQDVLFAGSWTQAEPKTVRLDYRFDGAPADAGLILGSLLDGAQLEVPEYSTVSAPLLASVPEGWAFTWTYPDGLAVDPDTGVFSVGTADRWPDGTLRIVGKWTRMEYTVTYRYGGAVPADSPGLPAAQRRPWGAAVPLAPEPASTDAALFQGWRLPEGLVPNGDGQFKMPAEDIEITGTWITRTAEMKPQVKLEPNGGTWDGSGEDRIFTQEEYAAQKDTLAPAVRDGHIFLEWKEAPDPEGVFALIVSAVWAEDTPPEVFTVFFDAQGGTAAASQSVPAGQPVSCPADPVREGFRFLGWYRDPEGLVPWDFVSDLVTGDLTLYARWEEPDGTYAITGVILDEGGNPVSGAEVRAVKGNTLFQGPIVTGPDGRYAFQQIPPGVYNVVALYDGITTTILAVVKNRDLSLPMTIYRSTGSTNSILRVEEAAPDVVVGNLELEAERVRQDAASGGTPETVRVEMKIAQADETAKPAEIRAIREAARRDLPNALVDLILDIDVTQAVQMEGGSPEKQAIHHTANVLELVIPYDMTGKTGVRVHRYHNAGGDNEGAVTFREISAFPLEVGEQEDGVFYLDRENNLIHVYAKKFSIYAVSCAPETVPETPALPGSPGGSVEKLWIIQASADSGGAIAPEGKVSVPAGADKTFTIRPESGYVVRDLIVDGESAGAADSYTFRNVRSNHTIQAVFAPGPSTGTGVEDILNTTDHIVYVEGFEDGTFRPEADLSRAQTAQIFYRLLRERGGAPAAFADVSVESWYGAAVNRLYELGVMVGVSENRFEPDRAITRAEFVAAAMRFTKQSAETSRVFPDVHPGDWFYLPVMGAVGCGWIEGYTDGTFRPDEPITRAEAAAIVNRILDRAADRAYIDAHRDALCQFPDVARDYWAYYEIEEAANGHEYARESGQEVWTDVTRFQEG